MLNFVNYAGNKRIKTDNLHFLVILVYGRIRYAAIQLVVSFSTFCRYRGMLLSRGRFRLGLSIIFRQVRNLKSNVLNASFFIRYMKR